MPSIKGLRFICTRFYMRTTVRARALFSAQSSVKGERFVHIGFNGGPVVALRPNLTDALVYYDTFISSSHLPPEDLQNVHRITDCGSSIGLTVVDFARRFPEAQILGIEMDAHNFAICQENIHSYADRCQVIEGALWDEEGTVQYGGDQEWGYSVLTAGNNRARAYSMNSLLSHFGGEIIDYVKMDIEGAEQRVLAHASNWASQVRCLKVEVHAPYTVEMCIRDLTAAGFVCELFAGHYACVLARNPAIF